MSPKLLEQKNLMILAASIVTEIETIEKHVEPFDATRYLMIREQLIERYAEAMARLMMVMPIGESRLNVEMI